MTLEGDFYAPLPSLTLTTPPPLNTHTYIHTFAELKLPQSPVLQGFLNTVLASRSNNIIQLKRRTAKWTEPTTTVGTAAKITNGYGLRRRQRQHREV